jgi:hypothetical protein
VNVEMASGIDLTSGLCMGVGVGRLGGMCEERDAVVVVRFVDIDLDASLEGTATCICAGSRTSLAI